MNAERLLAQFERISEAPDAIARLRRFILDLAVRGKLVEQDPEDEPAEDQLERIIFAKLEAGRKQRASTRKPENQVLEPLAYDLPSGWVTASLADLVSILNGRAYKQAELLDAGTPVLRVGNLFTSNKWYYSNLELDDDKYIDNGDLIFAWSASFGPFVWGKGRVIYHYHIWKLPLHSPPDLSRDYLYLYLLHKTAEIKDAGHGISMVHMTKEKMEGLEVPLPPLAEQHRIVAKVDELMALCDQLEAARQQREQSRERLVAASLQRLNQPAEDPASFRQDASFALQVLPSLTTTPAQIKQLRQTILNLAVRGKLVEQDPEDEPAVDLLATISFERVDSVQSRKMKSSRPVAPYDGDGEYELPRGWTWSQLGSITAVEDGAMCDGPFGSKLKTEHYISEPGFAVVRLGNIGIGEFLWGKEGHITSEHFESLPGNHIRPGDLLIAGLADPLVRCCEAPANLGPAVNKADCFRLRLHRLINRFFVCHYLNSPVAKSFAAEENHGMTRERINLGNAKSIPIPLPPLAEQHRIVAKVDELMALCDQLEQQLSQADQQRRRLLEAVLAEALGGRLPTGQEESHAAIA
jgi:type I restriction enzyme S subunit